jgi:guanylate kinase
MSWRLLVLLSGPSGVGKGTIGARLREIFPELLLCPSATTRSWEPRDAEGEYLYVSRAKFTEMWDAGELLEADPHFDNWYGLTTPTKGVMAISDIDVKGSIRLSQTSAPNLLRIAILPPGATIDQMVDVCTARMDASRTDAAGIAKRRARATEEIQIIQDSWCTDTRNATAVVINNDLETAVKICAGMIRAHLVP